MIQVLTYQLKIPKHVWGHVAPPFEFRSLKNSPSQKGHGLNHLVCWKSSSWILNFSTSDTLKMHKFIPGSDFWRFDRRFNAHLFEQEFFHQQYHWHFWKKKNKKDSVQSPPRGTPHLQKSYRTLVRVYRSFPIKNASLDYASYSDEYVLGLPIFFWGGVTLSLTLQEMIQFFFILQGIRWHQRVWGYHPCQKKICTYPDEEVHHVFLFILLMVQKSCTTEDPANDGINYLSTC